MSYWKHLEKIDSAVCSADAFQAAIVSQENGRQAFHIWRHRKAQFDLLTRLIRITGLSDVGGKIVQKRNRPGWWQFITRRSGNVHGQLESTTAHIIDFRFFIEQLGQTVRDLVPVFALHITNVGGNTIERIDSLPPGGAFRFEIERFLLTVQLLER